MYGDMDNFGFDFDVISSPIVDRDVSMPEFSYTEEQHFELQAYPDSFETTFTPQPFQPYNMQADCKCFQNSKKFEASPAVIRPKALKQKRVFHPFESFEATELTVRSLMKGKTNHKKMAF